MDESQFLSNEQVDTIHEWIYKIKKKSLRDEVKEKKAKHALGFRYKIIGCGRHRIVYDLRNGFVLKVAVSKRGLRNNKTEYRLYKRSSSNLRKYLCKVEEYGYGWVVMKKVKPLDSLNEKYERLLEKTRNKFLSNGIEPHDLKLKNVSYSRSIKRIIVMDYGDFKK